MLTARVQSREYAAASIEGSTPLLQSMTEHTKHYSAAAFVPYTSCKYSVTPAGWLMARMCE